MKLRNRCLAKSFNVLFHFDYGLVCFVAGVCVQQFLEPSVAICPCVNLDWCIFNDWQACVVHSISQSNLFDYLSSFSVFRVSEAWVIGFLNALAFTEGAPSNVVHITDSCREPWHFGCSDLLNPICDQMELTNGFLNIFICRQSLNINEEVSLSPVVFDKFRRN